MRMIVITAALVGAAFLCGGPGSAAAFQPTRVEVSDVVVGLGAPGPYALSYTNIATASERVEVNGVPLLRGIDYTIDWAKGAITFTRPLSAHTAACISYLRQPGQSQPNQQPVDLPAAIALGNVGGADLALAMRFQQQPAGAPSAVYGLRAGRQGETSIDAALFFSQLAAADGRSEGTGRASGWRIGAQRSYSQLDLAASLTRAQKGFAASQDLPAAAGLETLNLAAKYRPSHNLMARASLTTADAVTDPSHASTRTTEYGLTAKPVDGADVSLSRTQVESQQGSGSLSKVTDTAQANVTLGSASASAAYQRAAAGEAVSEAESLRVASSLRQGLNVAASHSETHSDSAHQRGSEVSLEVATWSQARLRAMAGARRGDQVEDYHGVEATLKPGARLTLVGAYKQRDYGAAELNTRRAAIAVSPLKRVEIGGEYAQNPEDDKGAVRRATSTTVRVGAQLGIMGLSGSVARQIAVAGDERRAGEVRLSLTIAAAHKLYTGYSQSETIPLTGGATGATDVYLLGYEHIVGGDFSLSLEGQMERNRDYQQFRTDTQQRADAKLNWRF